MSARGTDHRCTASAHRVRQRVEHLLDGSSDGLHRGCSAFREQRTEFRGDAPGDERRRERGAAPHREAATVVIGVDGLTRESVEVLAGGGLRTAGEWWRG